MVSSAVWRSTPTVLMAELPSGGVHVFYTTGRYTRFVQRGVDMGSLTRATTPLRSVQTKLTGTDRSTEAPTRKKWKKKERTNSPGLDRDLNLRLWNTLWLYV